jgi:hypothetical protein
MANPIFSFRKRVFLNPLSTGYTSYVLAEIESSHDGGNKWGHCMLTMADCRRRIQLEFFLGTKHSRRISLAKIDLLINVLTAFRDQLREEANRIEAYRPPRKAEKKS